MKDHDLLQLPFDQFFELEYLLVALLTPQNDVQLCQRRLVFVELPLHQGVIVHERLGARDLFEQKVVQPRGVISAQHLIGTALHLKVGLRGSLW